LLQKPRFFYPDFYVMGAVFRPVHPQAFLNRSRLSRFSAPFVAFATALAPKQHATQILNLNIPI
jgi:hypothetical protein